MAITSIDDVESTDTFENQRLQINKASTKLNVIDLNKTELRLEDSSAAPSDPPEGSFVLYMDQSTGDIKIKKRTVGGSATEHTVDLSLS